jgi:ribosome maturation factor RimP
MEKTTKEFIPTLTALVEPIITSSGFFLEELKLTGRNPQVLTVVIDSEGSLTLDEVTVVTKAVSGALGETTYTLEVTSPGIDRPLTLPRHWRKNRGRLVNITLAHGENLRGRIGDVGEAGVAIDDISIEFATMTNALVEIEFTSLKVKESE